MVHTGKGFSMEYSHIGFVLSPDSLIAIISILVTILIALVGGIYAIVTNTKKYELTECFRKELLDWYSAVVKLMIRIIHFVENGDFSDSNFISQKMRCFLNFLH